jgi:hypothetical protein
VAHRANLLAKLREITGRSGFAPAPS